MKNKKSPLSLSLCLISILINFIFPLSSFSQNNTTEEIMTFETYYPAPFGVYNEMRAKKMAVGDNYYNGTQYCWSPATCSNQIDGTSSSCWPDCNTDLVVEGNVGIGTTNSEWTVNGITMPVKLYVDAGNGNSIPAMFEGESTHSGDPNTYIMIRDKTGGAWGLRAGNDGHFAIHQAGVADRLNILPNGNVGIGTTSPQDRIHVEGNATGDGGPGNVEIRVQNTGNAAAMIDLRGGGSGSRSYLIYSSGPDNVIGAGKLAIAAVGRVADLVVDASGNVGIKTTPQSTLHLYEEGANGAHIKLQAASGRGWNILSAGSASGASAVGNFHIYYDGAPTANLFIQGGTGYVGIGTTNPGSQLSVGGIAGDANGALRIFSSNYNRHRSIFMNSADSTLAFNNGVNAATLTDAGTWTDASDIAIKTDIVDMSKYGLDTVMQMKPREYKMKSDLTPQIGFIAQEVNEIIPEIVSGEQGSKGLAYGHLTAVLAKAIQEQQREIEELREKLASLEAEK